MTVNFVFAGVHVCEWYVLLCHLHSLYSQPDNENMLKYTVALEVTLPSSRLIPYSSSSGVTPVSTFQSGVAPVSTFQ